MLTRTHAAFLRGLDQGDRSVTMQELRAAFAPLGYDGVATWRERGDVAFATHAEVDGAVLESSVTSPHRRSSSR